MVRNDGARDDGEDIIVPLIPVVERISYEEAKEKRRDYLRKQAFMSYFYPGSNDVAVLRFADAHWTNIDVLDLAVLEQDGFCQLNLNNLEPIPPQFTPGWRIHISKLIERFVAHGDHLEELKASIDEIEQEATKKTLWRAVMPQVSLTDYGLPSESYLNGVFTFGLRRVTRCRQPGAHRLLKAYTQYLSREANDPDFARPSLSSN